MVRFSIHHKFMVFEKKFWMMMMMMMGGMGGTVG